MLERLPDPEQPSSYPGPVRELEVHPLEDAPGLDERAPVFPERARLARTLLAAAVGQVQSAEGTSVHASDLRRGGGAGYRRRRGFRCGELLSLSGYPELSGTTFTVFEACLPFAPNAEIVSLCGPGQM
jgi:hypothetical protein